MLKVTIRRGLPLTIDYEMGNHRGPYIEDWGVTHIGKKPCRKNPAWIKFTRDDIATIEDAIWRDYYAYA